MMMNHRRLCLLLFVFFLLETTMLPWITPLSWQSNIEVNPHLVLVLVLFIGLYVNRHIALMYGLIFGMLFDFIMYSPMLGPVSFAMGLSGYLAGLMQGRLYSSIVISMLVVGGGLLFYDATLFGIYRLFRVTHLTFEWAFLHRMLPSMLINLLLALAAYVPARRLLEGMPGKPAEPEQ
ncbi:rod shape-determining protein MreD [Paenibacillus sp. YYML68]|uniref:rod shape-determining protein MreD n=1 Tax=Paenibacillus sp. YYML68 TaxID=2909250 RepID=UPI00248F530C|nr:rod shape-determining protein MreD [Paenibacillus sp. YYML68]